MMNIHRNIHQDVNDINLLIALPPRSENSICFYM